MKRLYLSIQGQEINTGEAGISEWLHAIDTTFSDWSVYISPNLTDSEYAAMETIHILEDKGKVHFSEDLHLSVSMRSFRAEKYPIVLTRDILKAKQWLKEKARGSERYGLEDVATEFHIQGLELDWSCVVWDGDLRYSLTGWKTFSFKGNKWQNIRNIERKKYLLNAYRVLLTRARQGIVIVIPEGNEEDHTRKKEYYDGTYNYLKEIGLQTI